MTTILKLGGGAGVDHSRGWANRGGGGGVGARGGRAPGARDAANRLGDELGYPAQTITTVGGHVSRYTDARTIDIFAAAAGSVNQQMTAQLAGLGVAAVGLGGPNVIHARRHDAIRALRNGRQVIIRDDYTGAITGVDAALLDMLLLAGRLPVVAPLALGQANERLNVDGDLVAAQIARALDARALVILSNVPGLLRDVNDCNSLVSECALSDLRRIEGFAHGRMKKKLMAAAEANRDRVILADSRLDAPLDAALAGGGTHIVREVAYALAGD